MEKKVQHLLYADFPSCSADVTRLYFTDQRGPSWAGNNRGKTRVPRRALSSSFYDVRHFQSVQFKAVKIGQLHFLFPFMADIYPGSYHWIKTAFLQVKQHFAVCFGNKTIASPYSSISRPRNKRQSCGSMTLL